jgi:hypothetical protein
MKKTAKTSTRRPSYPLVGKHFHTIKEGKVQYQGRILEQLSEGLFLVVLYEFGFGQENGQYVFNVESFIWDGSSNSGVVFYDSAKEMKEAWENTWSHKASVERRTREVLGDT